MEHRSTVRPSFFHHSQFIASDEVSVGRLFLISVSTRPDKSVRGGVAPRRCRPPSRPRRRRRRWHGREPEARSQAPTAVLLLASEGMADWAPWISILRRYLLSRFVTPGASAFPWLLPVEVQALTMRRGRVPCRILPRCRPQRSEQWCSALRCRGCLSVVEFGRRFVP